MDLGVGVMSYDIMPTDTAFTNYLATVDVKRFSDYEWRLYKYLSITAVKS